ncbi:unnamed protein product [Arabidopsis thaliana]|uniref:Uncharacterized protein n=1 Tax=Arabidopsis thaliana TaxID=3702 RepID=A0A5S9Y7U8_ARATH|nr:unnamed protein product [Arabidopsis thaliana]
MSESVHPYLASSTISPNEAQLTVQEAGLLPSAIFGTRSGSSKASRWRTIRRGGGGERRGEMTTTLFKLKLREDMTIELIALLLLHPEWSTQVESGGPQLHQL